MIALWIICGFIATGLTLAGWFWLWEKIQIRWFTSYPFAASVALGLKNAHDGRLFYQIQQAAKSGSLSIKFPGTLSNDLVKNMKDDLGYDIYVDYPSSGIETTISWKPKQHGY